MKKEKINKKVDGSKRQHGALFFIKKYFTFILVFLMFLFLFVCDNLFHGEGIISDLKTISTSFTPTTDLFDDGSEVSFVSYFFGMKNREYVAKVVFFYPTKNPNISKNNEYLAYNYSGVVSCVCDGIVSGIGYTTDGEKYIEIEHGDGYSSRYVGLASFGIATGQMVGAKNNIAISSEGCVYKVYIHQNGNLIKASEIEWAE